MTSPNELIRLAGGGRTVVHRRGGVVIRDTGPWTPAVHALLRHLEQTGFAAAPRLVRPGLDQDGRETLTFIDGEFTQPGPWSLDGAAALGALLRDLHRATATFRPPAGAVWFPWAVWSTISAPAAHECSSPCSASIRPRTVMVSAVEERGKLTEFGRPADKPHNREVYAGNRPVTQVSAWPPGGRSGRQAQ